MNAIKWLGIFLLFGSGLVFGYEALSGLMSGGHMVNHTLVMVLGSNAFDWIGSIPVHAVQKGLNYIVNMHLYALMAITGVILLCINGLFAR